MLFGDVDFYSGACCVNVNWEKVRDERRTGKGKCGGRMVRRELPGSEQRK